MSRVERPAISAIAGKLEAAGQLLNMSYSERGEPLVDGHTADDVFLHFGQAPLDLPRSELALLVDFLRAELDANTLAVSNLDLTSQLSPYDLRNRLGAVCAALRRRCEAQLPGIDLSQLTDDSIAQIKAKAEAIDPEVFAMAASKTYLTLIRTGHLEAADTLAGAFLPERTKHISFDLGSIDPTQIDLAYIVAGARALQDLGERNGEQAVPIIRELLDRGRLDPEMLRGRLREVLQSAAYYGGSAPEHLDPLIRDHLDRSEVTAILRKGLEHELQLIDSPHAFSFSQSVEQVIQRWKEMELRATSLDRYDAFTTAVRAAYLVQLANEGPDSKAAGAIDEAFDVAKHVTPEAKQTAIDEWGEHAIRSLFSNGPPELERLRELEPHVPAEVFEQALLQGVYRLSYGMHPRPEVVAKLKASYPAIDWSKVAEQHIPAVFDGVDLRLETEKRLESDGAKALARLFYDWHGTGSLVSASGSYVSLSVDHRVRALQDAAKRALELKTGSVAGSTEELGDKLVSILFQDEGTEERERRVTREQELEARLTARVLDAFGGKLDRVPYQALIELQNALNGVEHEMKLRRDDSKS